MKIYKIILFFMLLATTIINSGAYAYDGLDLYTTTITQGDRYNSNGQRLTTVRAILRQDRANNPAGFFASKANRGLFDSASIDISPGLAARIINGGAVLITVYVLTEDRIEVVPGPQPVGVD